MAAISEKPDQPAAASELYPTIAQRPHTIGELVDYANSIELHQVLAMAAGIAASLEHGRRSPAQLRRLVILGTLINRQIFEIEGLPVNRKYRI
jgi:hypothetical protein